jgi:hypothetical protein
MGKYEEARVMREFEVGVMHDAIVKAFVGGKRGISPVRSH